MDSIAELHKKYAEEQKTYISGIVEAFEIEKLSLAKQKEKLSKEKRDWNPLKLKLDKTQIDDKIKLDIGGTHFSISPKLLAEHSSYFNALINGETDPKKQEDGSIFIDRDPTFFGHILRYIRSIGTDNFNLEHYSISELEEIKEEAQFYKIEKLSEVLEANKQKKEDELEKLKACWLEGPNVKVTEEGKVVTYTGTDNSWSGTALGPICPHEGITTFTIKILVAKPGSYSNFMLGIAPNTIDLNASYNYVNSGWYLYTNGSTLYSGSGETTKTYKNTAAGEVIKGSTCKIIANMNTGELSYVLNGTDCGVAYKSLKTKSDASIPLHLCVMFYNTNDSILIVSKETQK